jgi:hypothetical protein
MSSQFWKNIIKETITIINKILINFIKILFFLSMN